MEHPLIENIDHMTIDELQARINDLTKKLSYAQRTNAHLASQIHMALQTFRSKYQEKQQKVYDEAKKNGPDYFDRIDIS